MSSDEGKIPRGNPENGRTSVPRKKLKESFATGIRIF
jgi:hypothetical protein